jgi:Flp pilus assembly protein TadG
MHENLQRGSATVELALVLVLMLTLLSGMIDFGRIFSYQDTLIKATRDGARLMTECPVATLASYCLPRAQTLVVTAAGAAGLSPALTAGNVTVVCTDGLGVDGPCQDGVKPDSIRVSIGSYQIGSGTLLPIVAATAGSKGVSLSPQTSLRYTGA